VILIEFILCAYFSTILILSIFVASRNIIKSPILEGKLLLMAAIFTLFAILMATISMSLSSISTVSKSSLTFTRIGWLFVGPFYILITLAFLLPNFKTSYWHIFQLIIIVSTNIILSSHLFYNVKLILLHNGVIRVVFTLIDTILFTISTLLLLWYLIRRFQEVIRIQKNHKEFISMKAMISIILFAITTLLVITMTFRFDGIQNPLETNLPGYSFFIPFSFVFLIAGYHFYKDTSYPFVIPVKIYGVIFADHESGLTLLTKDYHSDIDSINLLGNLMTALNLSLQDTIKSNKKIEDIIFGDKVIHITSGKYISCIVIVSKNSLITKSITQYLCTKFESLFWETLKNLKTKPTDTRKFNQFEREFVNIKKYLI